MEDYRFCYITCPDLKIAEHLGQLLVSQGHAACANIIDGMRSIYLWKDKLESASECVLILKTLGKNLTDIERTLEKHHPYDNPCLIALPITGGSQEYLDWLASNSQGAK